jgi:hypothetical protein
MGGGDYKERERERVLCLTATPLEIWTKVAPPRTTSPVFVFGHNLTVGISPILPGPITPPEPRLASAQLASSRPRLPCHSLPSPAARFLFSTGIRGFQFQSLAPSPPPIHLHRSLDLLANTIGADPRSP